MMEVEVRALHVAHPLLGRWLECLQTDDQVRLLSLYHPDVQVRAFDDVLVGRRELADALRVHAKLLRSSSLRQASTGGVAVDRVWFETRLRTPWGAVVLRHEWALKAGLIARHDVDVARGPGGAAVVRESPSP